jgi:hypothetical protein
MQMASPLSSFKANKKAALSYHQIGKILWYSEVGAVPEELSDSEIVNGTPFRNHIEIPKNVTLDELKIAHHCFSDALAVKPTNASI